MEQRVFSGVRPTGHIHLGNYLGAIAQWVKTANSSQKRLFCVVDQHALTTTDDAKNIKENVRTIAAAYIACGIDPSENTIFVQSHVPFHTELAWYLSCIAPLGWLNRMTQFKDKAGKHHDQACVGLYAYPVLMAADILLYHTTHVPVGDDQKQHVELARDLAGAFNRSVGHDFFNLPEPVIQKETARIMSLRDGTKKMSKSDLSDYARIHLLDDNDTIALKIRKSKTDSEAIPGHSTLLEHRPEAKNLLSLYAILKEITLDQACQQFEGKLFLSVKEALTEALIAHLSPIRTHMHTLLKDPAQLDQILETGAAQALAIGEKTMAQVRAVLGLR